MSILQWDPMEDIDSLRRQMSRMLEERRWPLRPGRYSPTEERPMRLPLDAYSTDEEIVITAAVPGLSPEDVDVTLVGDTLTIEGTFRRPIENVEYLFLERAYGPFRRSVKINIPIASDQIEAKFAKGILTVILPKAPQAKPKIIEIKTQQG